MAGPVHYELYTRKTAPAPWSLTLATEDRQQAIETAEDLLKDNRAAAVRVTKETLDPLTMEFNSITLMTKGAPEQARKRRVDDDPSRPACAAPQDLYAPHARDLLSRVLEDWLMRQGVTAFELLHRPDLVERLEASGVELQHAMQKVAVPESQSTGQPIHELIRHYQRLAETAMERVVKAGRGGLFADINARPLADIATRLASDPDRAFVMGGVLSRALTGIKGGRARLDRMMDLADAAPASGAPRALVLVGLEQMLCELLALRTCLADILGPTLDQGASLAAVVRMAAPEEIERLVEHDPRAAIQVPAVEGPAARLGARLAAGEFPILASSLARMVLRELMSPRRLRPGDAAGEIDILRTLATVLTATAGRLLTLDEIQLAFSERSKNLVTADFVSAFVAPCQTVLGEAEALARLCENVTGAANKRSAARWLAACVTSLRFESEMRAPGGPTPSQKLAVLAQLQRTCALAGVGERDAEQVAAAIGAVGGMVEADAKLTLSLARAPASAPQRLSALLRMASGEAAPLGPAADRAKAEAIKLFRTPETRAAFVATPEVLGPLKGLMQAAGLAA